MASRSRRVFPGSLMLIYLSLGPIIWALHLGAIYLAHALSCVRGIASDALFGISQSAFIVFAATLLALAALFAMMYLPEPVRGRTAPRDGGSRRANSFYRRVMALLVVLSAVAIAWAGGTALIVSPCVALR